ncbi:alkaline phosphatase [Sporocytophaga myxococcoides]|uniref:Alkaline phosphatase n=1 Tax=Sporocytophaga myxococcoides TaxID=153721 RepID=A0A098LAM6_9BACT|nr:VTT domain-containing protein [Sporocytophaga myxococcoides]GAL83499.1 alkaline phosphatase [Sporocytophaga myxococcoides]
MDSILHLFQQLIDPEKLILFGGVTLILIVVFVENGLFFGFFLPGDTLLFTTGIFCATGILNTSILFLLGTISLAAVLGNLAGYAFGKKMGEALLSRKDSLLFKKKYIMAAEAFFIKYGGLALIMGRFLPIIRTFAPIFAGVVKFNFKKFFAYNVIGGLLWVFSMLLLGYFLGIMFPQIKEHLELFIGGIVVITWIPVIKTYLSERRKVKKTNEQI